jgi:hypothetical protein
VSEYLLHKNKLDFLTYEISMSNHLCNVYLIISVYLTGSVSLLATPGKYCYVDLRFMLIALETIVNIIFMCVA